MVTLLSANFLDREHSGLFLIDAYNGNNNKEKAKYVYFKNNELVCEEIKNSDIINGKDVSCIAMDITGDGISELLSLEDIGYRVYSIKNENTLSMELYSMGTDFTKKIYPFPNDYNGHGKIDLLYYDPAMFWNIAISTGTGFSKPSQCMRNNLLRTVRLNDKDRYRYSLNEMQKPTVTIRTADFDGDGSVVGCSSASQLPNITRELLRRGYSESDIEKIWGGNWLRVMREVQQAACE
jgi:hypothetical protein